MTNLQFAQDESHRHKWRASFHHINYTNEIVAAPQTISKKLEKQWISSL